MVARHQGLPKPMIFLETMSSTTMAMLEVIFFITTPSSLSGLTRNQEMPEPSAIVRL